MPDVFYTGTDWEGSSEPYINRNVIEADLWPVGAADGRDELEAGMHMAFAIGPVASRPHNLIGVSVTYDEDADRVIMNIARGFIFKAYVCNITTYAQGAASAWAATLLFGEPVYLDDSAEVGLGCNLSLAAANSAAATNPKVGYVWRAQTEEPDTGVGGTNTDPYPKTFASSTDEAWLLVDVLLDSDVY